MISYRIDGTAVYIVEYDFREWALVRFVHSGAVLDLIDETTAEILRNELPAAVHLVNAQEQQWIVEAIDRNAVGAR